MTDGMIVRQDAGRAPHRVTPVLAKLPLHLCKTTYQSAA